MISKTRFVLLEWSWFIEITAEEKGVDLYVLERAVAATHSNVPQLLAAFFVAYTKESPKQAEAVMKKLEEIRRRGRKREMIG